MIVLFPFNENVETLTSLNSTHNLHVHCILHSLKRLAMAKICSFQSSQSVLRRQVSTVLCSWGRDSWPEWSGSRLSRDSVSIAWWDCVGLLVSIVMFAGCCTNLCIFCGWPVTCRCQQPGSGDMECAGTSVCKRRSPIPVWAFLCTALFCSVCHAGTLQGNCFWYDLTVAAEQVSFGDAEIETLLNHSSTVNCSSDSLHDAASSLPPPSSLSNPFLVLVVDSTVQSNSSDAVIITNTSRLIVTGE